MEPARVLESPLFHPGDARTLVRQLEGEIPAERLAEAELVASELATYAMTQSALDDVRTHSGRLLRTDDMLRIEVLSESRGPSDFGGTQPARPDGLMVQILEALAHRFDLPRVGTIAWAELDL